ncbi:unnamed protein product [Candida verbasci]|uniref:mRNA-decapping enzyme subunit 1 n=1 Tax=Candida verbasci TaxID=1227364 RepID=A0A9W4TY67_9ASCO|nr:unnamed protein product [Candida verbasci]
MAESNNQENKQDLTQDEALKLYTNTLNFNVISRYDPNIKQLLCHTSHCVIYHYNEEEEWIKTDSSGPLALYVRDFKIQSQPKASYHDLQELFCYGLILMNRSQPECFSLGLLPNKISKHYFPKGVNSSNVSEMEVELNDSLIIVKNLLGEIYGLWIFNKEDRIKLFKSIEFCINSESNMI